MGGVVVEARGVFCVPRRHPPAPLASPYVSHETALGGGEGRAEGRERGEGVGGRERDGGAGGARGMSDRWVALDVALRA